SQAGRELLDQKPTIGIETDALFSVEEVTSDHLHDETLPRTRRGGQEDAALAPAEGGEERFHGSYLMSPGRHFFTLMCWCHATKSFFQSVNLLWSDSQAGVP